MFDRSIENLLDQGVPADAVQPGDRLESFTLDDATGQPVSLDQLVESGPAVIVFYRGGWCPYCNLALRTYQQRAAAPTGTLRRPAGGHQPPDPRPVALHRGEGGTRRSPFCPTRAAGSPHGSASRSSRPTTSSPPSASSASTWPKSTPKGRPACPGPPSSSSTATAVVRFVDVQPDYTARTEVADIVAALAALS